MNFQWDEANTGHIHRHGITTEEAEEVFCSDPVWLFFQESEGEFRRVIVGSTEAGRILTVVYTIRHSQVRVITAFPASPKRRMAYLARD